MENKKPEKNIFYWEYKYDKEKFSKDIKTSLLLQAFTFFHKNYLMISHKYFTEYLHSSQFIDIMVLLKVIEV